MRSAAAVALIAVVTAQSLAGQAQPPAVGSPPPGSDSIYALAVDPSKYPDESAIYLLDKGISRYETDGRGGRTYHLVVQVLKETAVNRYREFSFNYDGDTQDFTLHWMRVVKPNGEVISAQPAQSQDASLPASTMNPVYVNQKVKRISLSGVAVGTLIDYSYTIGVTKSYLEPDFLVRWNVTGTLPARRSHLVVDLPAGMKPHIVERNLNFARTTVTKDGRTHHVWATTEVPRPKPEAFAPDSSSGNMTVTVSSPLVWTDVAKWYWGLSADRYTVTPAVQSKIAEIVSKARTRDDSIRAIHKWVAQDVRYVSISLGIGGYQPRPPSQVLETGFGDCKDKATLFIAALKHIGVTAYPVLLNSFAAAQRELPALGQFNHAIAALPRGSGYHFVDLTAANTPFDRIPTGEQGGFAIVVHPDGKAEEVKLPQDAVGTNRIELKVVGSLSEDGVFSGRYEERRFGGSADGLRATFSTPLDSARRANLQRSVLSRFFTGAVGDSLVAFDGKDYAAEARVSVLIKTARMTSRSGDSQILNNPLVAGLFPVSELFTEIIDELATAGPRKSPIRVDGLLSSTRETTTFELSLPAGWKARLPANIDLSGDFGTYRVSYAQEGQLLRISRDMVGTRGTYPADRYPSLMEFMKKVAADDAKFFLIDKAGER